MPAKNHSNIGFTHQRTIEGHTLSVSSVKFSPDGTKLATSSGDKTIRIWDTATGANLTTLQGHDKGISDVTWHPTGRYMCSASDDMTLRLWDPHEGAMLRTLPGHTNYVLCCTFNSQGNTLASGSFDETVRMWDVRQGAELASIPAHSDPVTAVDFIHDGTLLVSSSLDGLCRLWDAHTSACHGTMINQGEGPPVSYVRFTPNGQYILRATLHESAMSLWAWQPKAGNRATFKIKRVYKGHVHDKYTSSHVSFITTIPGKQLVVTGDEQHRVFIWDVATSDVVQEIPGKTEGDAATAQHHSAPVIAVDAHPTQPVIATGAVRPDMTVKLWRA